MPRAKALNRPSRGPRRTLHRPLAALARLQHLIGQARSVAGNDRNPNRQAQLQSVLDEAFRVAVAAQSGGPLPPAQDHSRAR